MNERCKYWAIMTLMFAAGAWVLFALPLIAIASCIAQPQVEIKPEIKVDADAKVVGLDASTETHINAEEGSDVTSVSFNFAGLSGGAAVLVAVLYVVGRLLLTNKGQRVALDRLVQAIERAGAMGLKDDAKLTAITDPWERGVYSARKGIKLLVRDAGYNGESDKQDRAAKIIDKHLDKMRAGKATT